MIRHPAPSKQISFHTLSLGTVLACLIKVSEIIRLKLFLDLVLKFSRKTLLLPQYLNLYQCVADEFPHICNWIQVIQYNFGGRGSFSL